MPARSPHSRIPVVFAGIRLRSAAISPCGSTQIMEHAEPVATTATASQLNDLPVNNSTIQDVLTQRRASEDDPSSAFECNICLELAKDPIVTLCGHLYCWPCLYRWVCAQLQAHMFWPTRCTVPAIDGRVSALVCALALLNPSCCMHAPPQVDADAEHVQAVPCVQSWGGGGQGGAHLWPW